MMEGAAMTLQSRQRVKVHSVNGRPYHSAVGLCMLLLMSACGLFQPSEQLQSPDCEDQGACGEGFTHDGRVYGLICTGVRPDAVVDRVVASGQGVYEEARPIQGLATTNWLAVRGADLPCQPAVGEPLTHEWYLAKADQHPMTEADQDVLSQVTVP
jgi:hypothetical protein